MEGQYDILMQYDTSSALEDSIYKVVVLLREEREQAQRAKKNLADNMADLSHQLKTPQMEEKGIWFEIQGADGISLIGDFEENQR